MTDPAKPPIYPRYCFHLAPTVNTWCFLHATDVHDLDQHEGFEGENFFFYKNLPIKWVRVVGVVVAIDEFYGRRVYTVDDSSGACIECTVTTPTTKEAHAKEEDTDVTHKTESANNRGITSALDLQVGNVIDVKGGISIFRDEKQINIEKVTTLRCTAQEVALWGKRIKFRADILDKPWVLWDRDVRRCRREAEHSEEKAERKRRRLKAMIEGQSSKEPMNESQEQAKQKISSSSSKGPSRSNTRSLDLRQILRHGGEGKYDALGL